MEKKKLFANTWTEGQKSAQGDPPREGLGKYW